MAIVFKGRMGSFGENFSSVASFVRKLFGRFLRRRLGVGFRFGVDGLFFFFAAEIKALQHSQPLANRRTAGCVATAADNLFHFVFAAARAPTFAALLAFLPALWPTVILFIRRRRCRG